MKFNLKDLTEQELNLLLQGLGELPAKASMSMIHKIQSQAQVQLKAAAEAKALEAKVKKLAEDTGAEKTPVAEVVEELVK